MAELGVDLSNGRWRASATGELYETSESFVGHAKVWGQSGEIPLGCLPKERALGKRPNRGRNGGGQLLPNLLPLPAETSPKQDEPRTDKIKYVTEI
jgi:hypothetical protein